MVEYSETQCTPLNLYALNDLVIRCPKAWVKATDNHSDCATKDIQVIKIIIAISKNNIFCAFVSGEYCLASGNVLSTILA